MRLHPFTPFLLTLVVALLAILLPSPAGPVVLMLVVALIVAGRRAWKTLLSATLLSLPLWFFLLLLHGVFGGEGWGAAVGQGARLTAIILASLTAYRSFEPPRFLDAAATRGWSSGAALLVLATLQAAPRLRDRVVRIVEAQRARGLRVRGRPLGRLRALIPVALPLMLHTLGEVDARSMALDTRAAGSGRRTALTDVHMAPIDHWLLGSGAVLVLLAAAWRVWAG